MKFNLFRRYKVNDSINSVEAAVDSLGYFKNDKDFKLVFNDSSSANINCRVISFGDLTNSSFSDTLTIYKNGSPITKLDLRYAYSCSHKLDALKFQKFIAIGISGFLYLYDLSTETITLFIDFNGYFEEFKISEEHLLVVYNSGIYCLTKYGQIKWHNSNIGLDGIVLNNVENGKIYGSEQIDPPDGWMDFILDFETGNRVK